MNNTGTRKINTGGDPGQLPDYAALCAELSKFHRADGGDVDWRRVQAVCLRLFEHSGVELQTACWYTLARMHIAGLAGMNDGLFITGTLFRYRWSGRWPPGVPARSEILAHLSQQLQERLCTFTLTDHDDLNALYQSEKCLTELCDQLSRHALREASRLDRLLLQVRSVITNLENSLREAGDEPDLQQPLQAVSTAKSDGGAVRFCWPAELERGAVLSGTTPLRRRPPSQNCAQGTVVALILCGLLSWGIGRFSGPPPEECRSEAPLTPLLQHLSPEQPAWLQFLRPEWSQQYCRHLIRQTQLLWLDNPGVGSQKQAEADVLTELNTCHHLPPVLTSGGTASRQATGHAAENVFLSDAERHFQAFIDNQTLKKK